MHPQALESGLRPVYVLTVLHLYSSATHGCEKMSTSGLVSSRKFPPFLTTSECLNFVVSIARKFPSTIIVESRKVGGVAATADEIGVDNSVWNC